ncbi:DUF805 domain-containing protein [Methylomonas montana]|uniref:DUF805 domain-containing protein n=1 Tax=Methylomonas montana TaxID=3058963 RepID=UPI00265B6DD1|nr:DUF805 domain-containing protein [Methylomonas montana]WKJ89962.1 DUF805 domain-containing protein [Methylomonas montana]
MELLSMLRYNRPRYIALGLPSLLNALLLALYVREINTAGSHDQYAIPLYLVIAGGYGLFGVSAMIKRSRDMGSSAWGILLGFLFAPPLMLLVALVLIFVPSNPAADQLEPPPSPPTRDIWLTGMVLLVLPWLAVLLLRAL